jgi:hypothetical protein
MEQNDQLLGPQLSACPEDDSDFMELVARAVSGELEAKPVHGLFVVRIGNWFDHKWLNFSGKGRVAFGNFWNYPPFERDTALDEFHRTGRQSTFPPFTPNRVISQDFYGKDEYGAYILDEDGPWIHSSDRAMSSTNLHRRIATHNNSCLFVWFSSNTRANRRGSLMVYRANGRNITSWYASFSCDGRWRLVRTQAISRQHLSVWLAPRTIEPTSSRLRTEAEADK